MRYTTHILTSLIVFSTAAVGNAQDFRGFFNPLRPSYYSTQPSYGVTQSNYQFVQPYRVNQPCRNGICPTSFSQFPYSSTSTYGLPAACANGQCNHLQHQVNGQYIQGCLNGQCSPTSYYRNCANGQCGTGAFGIGLYQSGASHYSTIPVDRSRTYSTFKPSIVPGYNSQVQIGVPSYPLNQSTNIPLGTSINQPNGFSPYYN